MPRDRGRDSGSINLPPASGPAPRSWSLSRPLSLSLGLFSHQDSYPESRRDAAEYVWVGLCEVGEEVGVKIHRDRGRDTDSFRCPGIEAGIAAGFACRLRLALP